MPKMNDKPYELDKVAIRMVKEPPLYSSTPVQTPKDAVKLISELLKDYDREVLCIVNFRNDLTPINMNIVSIGALDSAVAHPREILKSTVLSNAASVMMAHNHPSGILEPSKEDIVVTDRMNQLFALLNVQMLDHIIIGNGDSYYSFKENAVLPSAQISYAEKPEQIQLGAIVSEPAADDKSGITKSDGEKTGNKFSKSEMSAEARENRLKEITDRLEKGVREIFECDRYKNYLRTMAKFHHYSVNNQLLIALQRPDATLLAGYQAWQKDHGRHVKKGEKGIQILAPAPYKVKKEVDAFDTATGLPLTGADGKPLKVVKEVEYPSFKVSTVFDVSQTEGKEIPSLVAGELKDSSKELKDLLQVAIESSPIPVHIDAIQTGAKGFYNYKENLIVLKKGMSDLQTLKTLFHEMGHFQMHSQELNKPEAERTTRSAKEQEAESVAYTVAAHFGLDTSEYSFGYIAGWAAGKDTKELKESLGKIRHASAAIIDKVEEKLAEKEHAQQLEAVPEALPIVEDKPSVLGKLFQSALGEEKKQEDNLTKIEKMGRQALALLMKPKNRGKER